MEDKYRDIKNFDEIKTPLKADIHYLHIEIYNIVEFLRAFWMAYLKSFVKKDKQGILSETKPIRVYTKYKVVKDTDIVNCDEETVNNRLITELSGLIPVPEIDYSSICILPCSLDETVLKANLIRDRAMIDDLEQQRVSFEQQRVSTALQRQESVSNFCRLYLFFKQWSLVLKGLWFMVGSECLILLDTGNLQSLKCVTPCKGLVSAAKQRGVFSFIIYMWVR